MATTEKPEFNRQYHAVYCLHCHRPIVLADDLARLPDPFRMMCHWYDCQQTATYPKSVVSRVRLEHIS